MCLGDLSGGPTPRVGRICLIAVRSWLQQRKIRPHTHDARDRVLRVFTDKADIACVKPDVMFSTEGP